MSPLNDDEGVSGSGQLRGEAYAENMKDGLKGMDSSSDEEDYDSDEEEDDEDRQGKVSVTQLLDKILKSIRDGTKDLSRSDHFASFEALDGDHLASNTGDLRQPTALHIIAAMDKKALPKLDSKMEPLIKFLVQHRNNLLEETDRSGHTPLFLAIEAKKEKMVQWMCDAHPSIKTVLGIPSMDRLNCVHIGIEKRVKFLDLLVERADAATLAAKNGDGNTPLHLAVEYKNCRKEQLAIIEKIVAKSDGVILNRGSRIGDFNRDGLSPYTHRKESVLKAAAKEKEKEKKRVKVEKEYEKGNAEREYGKGGGRSHLEVFEETASGQNMKEGKPPSFKAPTAFRPPSQEEAISLNRRIQREMESRAKYGGDLGQPPVGANSPAAYGPPAGLGMMADGKHIKREADTLSRGGDDAQAPSETGRRSSKVDEATVRNVERFLKLHYLRSRSYNAAMEILYGRNTTSDLELYFDLAGHANITQTGFENLLSKLKFEDVLQYVAIPKISVEVNMNAANSRRSRAGSSRPSQPDGVGRQDLCYIFDCLRKKGVKTILKVIVDDSVMPAHSDEAIEAALKFMDVEAWDWKKTDLCSEVICKVASRVREVHLYWSGNNAVLRGWSEPGGLKRLKELRTVYLHIQQGLESRARTQQNVDEFCERMKVLYPEVTVFKERPTLQRDIADASAARAEGEQAESAAKHSWIQCMTDFRKLLFDAERYYGRQKIEESIEEPIKVALIDDGVDVKDLEYTFIGGRTFCTRDEEHNLNNPYYVSSAGHGTNMARQIHLLCPQTQFYVLRLEDHPSEEGGRQLTAKSAANAIHAAILKKVHIISMSWTIDPPEDEDDRRYLENAIVEAANADILMFCSASDKGAQQIATYPAKATGKIFTIGAATATGAADPWVGSLSNINFTFPGNKVETYDGPSGGERKGKEITGSSVATALAAGLAALILYCVQVRLLLASESEKQKARRDFQALKKHDNMMRAFKDIGTTEASNHKFIEVWEVFGKKLEEKEHCDPDRWIDLIADVGATLCRKI